MEKKMRIGYENIKNKIGGGFKLAYLFIFCLSSRLPSLAFAAKLSQLLHFVAKISHSHCSSIFPLVSEFVPCLSSFPWFSLICP